jgi:uncharacterized membrane protein HdeD (DUF308 family)
MATVLDRSNLGGLARGALLAGNWWVAAVRGASAIVLGLLAVILPHLTLLGLVIIFALYCLVDGVSALVLAIRGARKHERWGWLAFSGVVALAAAGVALFYPFLTILALVILFAAWALVSGAVTIAAGARLSRSHGRWWLIVAGVIAIAAGLLMVFLPTLGMLTLTYLIGFQCLFAGITWLTLAFRLRSRHIEAARTEKGAGSAAPPAEPEAQRG